jgi:hypothetical protein
VRLDHFFLCRCVRRCGTKRLPFAGHSIGKSRQRSLKIAWDDSDFARFASYVETGKGACRAVAPSGAEAETPGSTNRNRVTCLIPIGFPVVIGAGSHPFPFRTRKLSLLPPMVLRGQLRGRVGHCRDYFYTSPLSRDGGLFSLAACRLRTSPLRYSREAS